MQTREQLEAGIKGIHAQRRAVTRLHGIALLANLLGALRPPLEVLSRSQLSRSRETAHDCFHASRRKLLTTRGRREDRMSGRRRKGKKSRDDGDDDR